jgi:VanZ family protein
VLRALSLWGPVVVYMAMIFFVSSLPTAPLPTDVSDKTGHLAAYLVLGVLAARACAGGLPARITRGVAIAALAVAIGYGAFDEIHQWFVPGRSAELADWYADTAGACLGLAACWVWGIIRFRSDV